MREDQVENGVKFLVHPKVKVAPLSQRISFLENKGLTSEEISAALSRVEGGHVRGADDTMEEGTGAGGQSVGSNHAVGTVDQPFAPEPEIPLWKKLAVPGALVAGAAGALGVYHATSATSSHRLLASQTVVSAAASGGARGVYAEGNAASENTAPADGDVIVGGDHNHDNNANADMATDETAAALSSGAVMREYRRQLDGRGSGFLDNSSMGHAMLEGVATGGNHGQVNNAFDAGENDAIGGGRGLAEEFRRLSEAMEHQTGQLVQAVGAMKTLASRAEQDSSSLLAARVNNHTSELRAELGTIKQLLLLQAGGGGAGAGAGAGGGSAVVDNAVSAVTASVGTVGATVTPGEVASTASDDSSARVAGSDGPSGKDEKRGASAAGTPGEASGVNEGGKGAIGGHDQSSRRAVVTARQADGKTAEESEKEEVAAKEAAVAAATTHRKEVARTALNALLAANSPQAAKDGIAMLRMLVGNLIKQPNVPRYRRIAMSNTNFKTRVLPLEGHRPMMEAIGFRAKGSLWEWTWHEDSGPSASASNKTVLEDIVAAIDAAARPNGPSTSSAHPPTASPPAGAGAIAAPSHRSSTPVEPSRVFAGTPSAANGNNNDGIDEKKSAPAVVDTSTTGTNTGAVWFDGRRVSGVTHGGGGGGSGRGGVGAVDLPAALNRSYTSGEDGLATGVATAAAAGPMAVGGAGGGGKGATESGGDANNGVLVAAAAEGNGGAVVVDAAREVAAMRDVGEHRLSSAGTVSGGAAAAARASAGDVNGLGDLASGLRGRASVDEVAESSNVGLKEDVGKGVNGDVGEEYGKISPPASMAEVAAAIQRGEEPPGICRVEDRLSADAPSLVCGASSTPSPPKPWEIPAAVSRAAAGGAAAAATAVIAGARAAAQDGSAANCGNASPAAVMGASNGGEGGYAVGDKALSLPPPSSPQLMPQSPRQAVSVGP